MRRYSAPALARRRPAPLAHPTAGPPRSFAEWSALRRWGKLPEPEREIPGYLLRLTREGSGLTQNELASRLCVTQPSITQAERWQSNPTVGFMRRWVEACGMQLSLGVLSK